MSESTPTSGGGKKKLVTRWEIWMIAICVLIFLYIIMKNAGYQVVNQEQKMELTDDPHSN